MGKNKQSLVFLRDNDVYTDTYLICKGFCVEHRAIKKLIVKYKTEFDSLGLIASPMQKLRYEKREGRPIESYDLNEGHAMFLGTLLTNNARVREFKLLLTKEFLRMKTLISKLIVQKQNAEWLEKREQGKIERRLETDTIKRFVEYAQSQGSQNAQKYYMIISKMENHSLFNLDFMEQKYPNLRDVVNGFALGSLQMADHVVAKALNEGIEKKMPYKDIYILAKTRVENFAAIIGKSPIEAVIGSKSLLAIT